MTPSLPPLSLIAMPSRRARTIELAQEVERRGFPSLWCPNFGDPVALSQAVLAATSTLVVGTSIQPIYLRNPADLGQAASFLHEVSGGRFRLGLGVSHANAQARWGVSAGQPLGDMRAYVEVLRSNAANFGPLPPIILATLRAKMLDLALDIADGAIWANASCSTIDSSIAPVSADRKAAGFTLGNMVPTVISDDAEAAAGVVRQTLNMYLRLPNYCNYWRSCGYEEDMDIAAVAFAARERDLASKVSTRFLRDVTLFGPASAVREGVERWQDNGVDPILVPSAVSGGQFQAFADVFAAFS